MKMRQNVSICHFFWWEQAFYYISSFILLYVWSISKLKEENKIQCHLALTYMSSKVHLCRSNVISHLHFFPDKKLLGFPSLYFQWKAHKCVFCCCYCRNLWGVFLASFLALLNSWLRETNPISLIQMHAEHMKLAGPTSLAAARGPTSLQGDLLTSTCLPLCSEGSHMVWFTFLTFP